MTKKLKSSLEGLETLQRKCKILAFQAVFSNLYSLLLLRNAIVC